MRPDWHAVAGGLVGLVGFVRLQLHGRRDHPARSTDRLVAGHPRRASLVSGSHQRQGWSVSGERGWRRRRHGGHSKSNQRLPRQEGRVLARGNLPNDKWVGDKSQSDCSARCRPDEKLRIKCHGADGSIISASGSGGCGFTSVKGRFEKDSTHITVSDAAGFNVGDYVEILQDNDPAVCEGMYDYMVRAIGQTMKVVAKNGRTLTVNRPLYFSYNPKARGGVYKGEMYHLTMDVEGLLADLVKNEYLDEKSFFLKNFTALRSASQMVLAENTPPRSKKSSTTCQSTSPASSSSRSMRLSARFGKLGCRAGHQRRVR